VEPSLKIASIQADVVSPPPNRFKPGQSTGMRDFAAYSIIEELQSHGFWLTSLCLPHHFKNQKSGIYVWLRRLL
jgi:hypothetical protein